MHYARFYGCDLVNGEGIRVTLFVSGCLHACEGCYNRATWDRKSGHPFTAEVEAELLDLCASHDGLSLSGGDPLHPHNREPILALCRAFKARYPDKDIWLWTGYRYEDICELPVMAYLDVLVDGKFEQDNPTTKPWRGSDNQRLFRLAQQPAPACA